MKKPPYQKRINPTSWSLSLEKTPLGGFHLTASENGLTQVAFVAEPDAENLYIPPAPRTLLEDAAAQLCQYLAGHRKVFTIPIDWTGITPFSIAVYQKAMAIPFGETISYGELGNNLGKENAGRAIGNAMACNPVPIFVPCHRVIGSDGCLHGYSAPGGLETKAWLLRLEGNTPEGNRLVNRQG